MEFKKMHVDKKILSRALSALFILGSVGCGVLPKKGKIIKINSNPGSEVILGDGSHNLGNSIGRTPLEVNFTEIAKGDFVYLKFVSDKHEDYQMILPSDWKQGELNVKLKKKEKILPSEVEEKMVDKMKDLNTAQILSVLSFQKQLLQGDLNKAGSEVVNLKRLRTPGAVVSLLEGNLNYLKGQKRQALNAYKRSYNLYPKNYEIKSIIEQLEKEIGR
ncbi:MAG: hypothetical protein ACRBBP_00075 [Bdellovibrionales bacterium]